MDEILASIRRIIDQGTQRVAPPLPANDPARAEDRPRERSPGQPMAARPAPRPSLSQADLDHFPQALDARVTANTDARVTAATDAQVGADAVAAIPAPMFAPDDGPAIDEHRANYGARFTEDDNRAFQTVAEVLSVSALETETPAQGRADAEQADAEQAAAASTVRLLSDSSRARIGASFDALDDSLRAQNGRDLDAMVEDVLRPMLSAWLDENLPPIVEKLVRGEIEAISRGGSRPG